MWSRLGAGEGEGLGLVGVDGVKEGGVVGGLRGGDVAVQKVNVARRGDDAGPHVVARDECGVVAVYNGPRGHFDAGAGRKVQRDSGIDIQRRAEINGQYCSGIIPFFGHIGDGELGKQRRNVDRFLGPVDEFWLGDFVFDGKRQFGGGRI